MIQCRPKMKSKSLIITSLLLILLSVALLSVSQFSGNFAALVQISAIASAAVSLFFLIKYVIPDYLYSLDNGHLTIHKITKSVSVCVADIELSSIKSFPMPYDEYKKQKTARKVYSFIKNPREPNLRYIVFEINAAEYALLFEPDRFFCGELENALKPYLYNNFDCEDND